MGRALLFGAFMSVIALVAASTRSDVAADTTATATPTIAAPEPITGTAVQPAPGSETYAKDPFVPFDVGPTPNDKSPKPLWGYSDLKPAEQAVVDRGRNAPGWAPINDAFARATAERAQRAAVDSAAAQLGAGNLGAVGVVP